MLGGRDSTKGNIRQGNFIVLSTALSNQRRMVRFVRDTVAFANLRTSSLSLSSLRVLRGSGFSSSCTAGMQPVTLAQCREPPHPQADDDECADAADQHRRHGAE